MSFQVRLMKIKVLKHCHSKPCGPKIRQIRLLKLSGNMYMMFMHIDVPRYFYITEYGIRSEGRKNCLSLIIEPTEYDEAEGVIEVIIIPETAGEELFIENARVLSLCEEHLAVVLLVSKRELQRLYEKSAPVSWAEKEV